MRAWTVGRKLFAVLGTVLGLFLLSLGLVFRVASNTKENLGSTEATMARLAGAQRMTRGSQSLLFLEKSVIVAAYVHDRELRDARIKEAEEECAALKSESAALAPTLVLQANKDDLRTFDAGLADWRQMFTQVANLSVAEKPDEAQKLSKDKSRPLMEQNAKAIDAIAARLTQVQKDDATGLTTSINGLTVTLGGILIVVLIVAAVAWYVVRSITQVLKQTATALREGAEQVVSASSQVATSAQSLSQGATEQAASIEETSASMEEMTSMTQKNADNAQQAAALVVDVVQQVDGSNAALGDMVTAMAAITESSNRVAKIIKTIDEIAFQTNILALNAAVEAARAGEAGMGFAVVADEVRNLAQRSAQAAKDTAQMIEESIGRSQAGAAKVEQVSTAIGAITDSVTKVKTIVEDVYAASQQQTQGIGQVSQAIQQMEQVTQTTAATAEESAAASEELNSQAETSMGIVQQLERMVGGHAIPSAPKPVRTKKPARVVPLARAAASNAAGKHSAATAAERELPLGDTGTYGTF